MRPRTLVLVVSLTLLAAWVAFGSSRMRDAYECEKRGGHMSASQCLGPDQRALER